MGSSASSVLCDLVADHSVGVLREEIEAVKLTEILIRDTGILEDVSVNRNLSEFNVLNLRIPIWKEYVGNDKFINVVSEGATTLRLANTMKAELGATVEGNRMRASASRSHFDVFFQAIAF